MAFRLVNPTQTLLVYRGSRLQPMVLWLRCISNKKCDSSGIAGESTDATDQPDLNTSWLDVRGGILGPEDKRCPLPGNIGFSTPLTQHNLQKQKGLKSITCNDINSLFLENNYHFAMIRNAIASFQSEKLKISEKSDAKLLEYKIQSCPHLLRKDFQVLFPATNLMNGFLTIVTVCQKTKNDMSEWSESAEMEREKLTDVFVTCSIKICETLNSMGFWAEFIDPMSGSPYFGPHTNSTFFETDERYRYLGFRIEDLGCCKVISHRTWGTRIYVGCLFTNARPDIVEELLKRDHTGGERPVICDFKKTQNPGQGD